MRFELTRDARAFAARTDALLAARIECNIMETVLANVLRGHYSDPPPLFAWGVDAADTVRFAALRTPPWSMLCSRLADRADALVELWLAEDPELPGVNGPTDTVRAIAAEWERRTAGRAWCRMREAIHVLEAVRDPPRPARGRLRVARAGERALLVAWWDAFVWEAGASGGTESERMVRIRMETDSLLVWDDDGPVSMIGVTSPVGGVVRVGPVYTPPDRRRRGYAGTAVAEASRRALAAGARRCTLFTDITNPTSNKIYAEVGYERVGEFEELAFEAPGR